MFQVIHRGPTMWIVNKYGWIGNGNIDQCICINIREGGNASNPNPIYPINYNWVDNLVYVAREIIGVEWLSETEGELTDVELDHWAYGPHHLWSYPESGQILRMWQPFNGLQVRLFQSSLLLTKLALRTLSYVSQQSRFTYKVRHLTGLPRRRESR